MKAIFLSIIILTSLFHYGQNITVKQDIILKTNGEKIECRIINVSENKVYYIKSILEPLDVFSIKRKQIDDIFYMESSCKLDIASDEFTFTDPRDGYTYPLFKNEDQIWFAENLRFDTIGSTILDKPDYYEQIYGRLYTFDVAKKACPCGWHLPSDNEWKTLERALGMKNDLDTEGWRGNPPGQGNLLKPGSETNFNALFGGGIIDNDPWHYARRALFWSCSVPDMYPSKAWTRQISKRASIYRFPESQHCKLSVRCVKNP